MFGPREVRPGEHPDVVCPTAGTAFDAAHTIQETMENALRELHSAGLTRIAIPPIRQWGEHKPR